jgi:hypothetical protein
MGVVDMKIVVVTRCLNGLEYIDRFVRGYDFATQIVVSEGGSDDGSVEKWMEYYPKVRVFKFDEFVMRGCYKWNPDNNHIQHAIDKGLDFEPDFLILDDLDDVPNFLLRKNARDIIEECKDDFIFSFRLYLWGDGEYFPKMNNHFDPQYRSMWGWFPHKVSVRTDKEKEHGTLIMDAGSVLPIDPPMCLLHKSWHPDTMQAKVDRYNAIGLPMNHPLEHPEAYGVPEPLPEWAYE